VARVDLDVIIKLHQFLKETVVHILDTSARKVCPAALSDEESVTGEQFVVKEQTDAVWSVARCMDYVDADVADSNDIFVNDTQILIDA
jgi:hypothetical protein